MDKSIIVCYLKYSLSISIIFFLSCGIQNDPLYDQELDYPSYKLSDTDLIISRKKYKA